jgi:dTMP kinase
MLITFEGIDGCGKSTQARLLVESLRKEFDREVVFVRDPGNTSVSEAVRAIVLRKTSESDGATEISPRTELLLFAAARAELVETVIRPALERGAVVVSDRFTDSTLAYQGFGRELPMDDIHKANTVATGGIQPALTFFLNLPLYVAKERCIDKDVDRIESAGDSFYARVITGYCFLADADPQRIKRLDAMVGIEELHEQVWNYVSTIVSNAVQ